MSEVIVDISEGIATITFNRPRSLNAITKDDYASFANALRDIDKRPDVLVTVWQATGKWFCAGTHIERSTGKARERESTTVRDAYLKRVAEANTDCCQALYSHSKILVAALNGPVMGIAAAFLGQFDFIYCLPHAWLSVPFTFLGIISEAGSSVSFINRIGIAKANEVLLLGRKQTAEQLVSCGFVNEIFPASSTEDFHIAIRRRVLEDVDGLDPTALLAVKSLLRTALNERNNPDAANLRESYVQAARFASGIPSVRFAQIASKEIRHKL